MPNLRDRSKLNKTVRSLESDVTSPAEPRKTRWSIKEKRAFLNALKCYKPEEAAMIRKIYFPKKSLRDVESFIAERLAQAKELSQTKRNTRPKPPDLSPILNLKDWLKKINQLIGDSPDYSFCMGQAIENFLIKNQFAQMSCYTEVRWSLMYEYLMCLLNDQPLPELGQLEAGTFLILLEDLVVRLHSSDVADVQKLLSTKHQLLTTAWESSDKETTSSTVRQALNLDILKVHYPEGQAETAISESQQTTATSQSSSEPSSMSNRDSVSTIPTSNNNTSTTASSSIPAANGPTTTKTASDSYTSQVFVVKDTDKQSEPLFSINPLSLPISLLNPTLKKFLK